MVCEPEGTQDEAISNGSFLLWMATYDRETMGVQIGGHRTTSRKYVRSGRDIPSRFQPPTNFTAIRDLCQFNWAVVAMKDGVP
jgi:hypothetical protein